MCRDYHWLRNRGVLSREPFFIEFDSITFDVKEIVAEDTGEDNYIIVAQIADPEQQMLYALKYGDASGILDALGIRGSQI